MGLAVYLCYLLRRPIAAFIHNIQFLYIMYPPTLTAPMAQDLTEFGFEALSDPNSVEQILENHEGTALVVVNSVCGCAAAMARPGAKMSLQNDKVPGKLYTVFAGVDTEAVAKVREFLAPYPASSPSIAHPLDAHTTPT